MVGTATDRQKNLIIEGSNCPDDFRDMNNQKVTPRYELSPGSTSGGSVSIESFNSYLRESLADKSQNKLVIRGKQTSIVRRLNLDRKSVMDIEEVKMVTAPNKEGKATPYIEFKMNEMVSVTGVLGPVYKATEKRISGRVALQKIVTKEYPEGKLALVLDKETFKRVNRNKTFFTAFISTLRSLAEFAFLKDVLFERVYMQQIDKQGKMLDVTSYASDKVAGLITDSKDPEILNEVRRKVEYKLNDFGVSKDGQYVNFSGRFANPMMAEPDPGYRIN